MIDLAALKPFENKHIELRFNNGYVAHVRLVDVDADQADRELIYDVVKVLDWGPVDPKAVKGNTHSAGAAEIVSWRSLD
jgi:hypothetical protein